VGIGGGDFEAANAVAIDNAGNIVVAGEHFASGVNHFALVRLLPSGDTDSSFAGIGAVVTDLTPTDDTATAIALQNDGKIVVAGVTEADFAVARYMGGSAATSPLLAAVLPLSRTVQTGDPATAFATIINTGNFTATGCSIAPLTDVPATFLYQTTDPATNQLTGSPNTPVSIPAGGLRTFLMALTPNSSLDTTEVQFNFDCTNTQPAPIVSGINTLLFTVDALPTPDMIAMASTVGNTGIVNIPGPNGAAAFAVATVNVGAQAVNARVRADLQSPLRRGVGSQLPAKVLLCQTNPQGNCLSAPKESVTVTINAGATPTFGAFVMGSGTIPLDPTTNHIEILFDSPEGQRLGSTVVAVRTQ
jgi:hypothetical protein